MKTFILALLAFLASSFLQLAPAAASPVHAEIEALLVRLQASGCEFNRNGTWYSGTEAKTHLLRKLEYLEGRKAIERTEQFIELGASSSSSTGKPYLVKCESSSPVPSNQWLSAELAALRAASRAAESGAK